MEDVRRDDGELCGGVAATDDGAWEARTVFGAVLGRHPDRATAVARVRAEGLACLAERWTLVDPATGTEEPACIVEASPAGVTVARDLLPHPGAETLRIGTADLASGRWLLRR